MKKGGGPRRPAASSAGAAAIEAIADAIRKAGSTDGSKLASVLLTYKKHSTISGRISFSTRCTRSTAARTA